MDEKFLDYMTKTEYASEYPGVVKNAEHADSATGSQFADNAIKLGGNESTYYASAATMNEVLKTANGAQSTATGAQTLASEAKLDAAAAKSAADNAQATANACIPKSDITEATGDFTTKVMSQKATTEQLNLCMKKADYDSDGDGIVERADEAIRAESTALADNALKLNGKAEAELSVASSENAAKLGNKLESELNVAHSINADMAARLGEYGPDYFAKVSDILPAKAKLITGYPANVSGQGATYAWDDGQNVYIVFYVLFTPGGDGIPSGGIVANFQNAVPLPARDVFVSCVVGKANNTWISGVCTASKMGELSIISGDQEPFSRALGQIVYTKKL